MDLFFILTIDEQESLQQLNNFALEFLKNPTFCQFCLWFLENWVKLSPLRNAKKVYELLVGYGREQINGVRVDHVDVNLTFPALSILSYYATNSSVVEMLCDILAGCSEMKHLSMRPSHPVEQILSSVRPVFKTLRSIQITARTYRLEDTLVDSKLTKRVDSAVVNFLRGHINTENEFNVVLCPDKYNTSVSVFSPVFKMCVEAPVPLCLHWPLWNEHQLRVSGFPARDNKAAASV